MNLKTSLQSLQITSQFKNILELCTKHGFLKYTLDANSEINKFLIGPNGALLQENLRREWLSSTLINNNIISFLNINENKVDAFNYIRNMCQDKLPYEIVSITHSSNANEESTNFANCFNENDRISLTSCAYVSAASSTQLFHQSQRQRRMWWRKFSASPGRYTLTDLKSDTNNNQSVQIKAEYPWGDNIIESIHLKTFCDMSIPPQELQFRDGRKKIEAHTIESRISLPVMLLNILCDAYDEPPYHGEPRPILRLHRKLAPFKISFAITAIQATIAEELSQLALYLCKQLKANNVSSFLLPALTKQSLDNQWKQYDQLGIPYCILLNDATLKNGIAQLRSRDTTLKEQVHITDLPKYVEQLYKNY